MAQAEKAGGSPARYSQFGKLYIDGKWRLGRSGKTLKDTNPYNGETLAEIALANLDDLDEAYQRAAKAQPAWAETGPAVRSAVLLRVAAIMEARRQELAEWIIREAGGTQFKAQIEVSACIEQAREAASFPTRVEGRIFHSNFPGKECRVYRGPVGVIGVISPWNFPLILAQRSVAPALALGNAVVLKPASDTPISGALLLAKVFDEAGLPAGLLNVVVGAGSEIGDAFVLHLIPRVISFTGSTAVGRRVAECASKSKIIKRTALELGGNAPCVVLADADIGQAVKGAVFGKFIHQGQVCMSTNRVIVDAKIYDEFTSQYVERVRQLKAGDPMDPATVIGPIINRAQLERLCLVIQGSKAEGARQILGGSPSGLLLPAHVFSEVKSDMSIAKEELFGPVAPLIKASGEEDALRIANDTEYGLSSAVFTRDLERGVTFARKLQTGMTHVNDSSFYDEANLPFGGEKNSGIGRFNGHWVIDEFTTDHLITVQHVPASYPF
jgi:aldehyde dehydrogenase (NAD+)